MKNKKANKETPDSSKPSQQKKSGKPIKKKKAKKETANPSKPSQKIPVVPTTGSQSQSQGSSGNDTSHPQRASPISYESASNAQSAQQRPQRQQRQFQQNGRNASKPKEGNPRRSQRPNGNNKPRPNTPNSPNPEKKQPNKKKSGKPMQKKMANKETPNPSKPSHQKPVAPHQRRRAPQPSAQRANTGSNESAVDDPKVPLHEMCGVPRVPIIRRVNQIEEDLLSIKSRLGLQSVSNYSGHSIFKQHVEVEQMVPYTTSRGQMEFRRTIRLVDQCSMDFVNNGHGWPYTVNTTNTQPEATWTLRESGVDVSAGGIWNGGHCENNQREIIIDDVATW